MATITDQLLLTDDGQRLINDHAIRSSTIAGPKGFLDSFAFDAPHPEQHMYGRTLEANDLNKRDSDNSSRSNIESIFNSSLRMDVDAIFVPWSFFSDAKVSELLPKADNDTLSLTDAIKWARDTGHTVAVVYPGSTPAELKRAGTVLEAVGLGSAEIHRFN